MEQTDTNSLADELERAAVREIIAAEAYRAGVASSMAAAASGINEGNLMFRCALAAYKVALRQSAGDAGAVERKPTEAMIRAGLAIAEVGSDRQDVIETWEAMFAAALASRPTEAPEADRWRKIETSVLLKGNRRNPKYYPVIGEMCRMSGPNCDDADGYTWSEVEVLWRDDLFIVTRVPGCWPTVTKLELALFEPTARSALKEPTDATD